MPAKKYTCIVCGRVFPEGQGIVIRRAGVELAFHSKACLAKFFRLFVEKLDEREFKRAAVETVREFEQLRKMKQKAKVI
jgi:large subunit ribosomal protein L24e